MKKGIIYTRVSSDEQVKGTSLEDQEKRCKSFCKDNDIDIVKIFKEEGVSAKSADRKELLNAVEYCRENKGKIDFFVVYKVDRFARNTEDHFSVRAKLLSYGVELRSVSEQIGNDPSSKLTETILSAMAEFDNSIRAQRSTNGMKSKMESGIWPWGAPVGYKANPQRESGGKKTLPDVPDPDTFGIIQIALREFSQGQHTQISFGRRLEELGLDKIRGKKVTPQYVQTILDKDRLKFYSGIFSHKWLDEEILALHEPMITEDECFSILQYLNGKQKGKKKAKINNKFPLRGTILCGSCNKPLTGSSSRGNGGLYHNYHCFNKDCPIRNKTISRDLLADDFRRKLDEITPTKEFMKFFKKAVLDEWKIRKGNFTNAKSTFKGKKETLEKKLERIYEMREDGSYSKEEFFNRKEKIENEITTLKISENESHIEELDMEMLLSKATTFFNSLGEYWEKCPVEIQHRFQKLVFPEGIPYSKDTGFGTTKMGLIFKLNQEFNSNKSTLVTLDGTRLELLTWQGHKRETLSPFWQEPSSNGLRSTPWRTNSASERVTQELGED